MELSWPTVQELGGQNEVTAQKLQRQQVGVLDEIILLTPAEFMSKMLLLQSNSLCYSNVFVKIPYETKGRSEVLKNSRMYECGSSYIVVFKNSYKRF